MAAITASSSMCSAVTRTSPAPRSSETAFSVYMPRSTAARMRGLARHRSGPHLRTVDILLDVTNPGLWMAHCHIAEHHESGMAWSFNVAPAESD
jgi:FtsP/CotA-like multicopper oxidase with cupredoxin domain